MEASNLFYGVIDTKSYLNVDDINGIGLGSFPKKFQDPSIDFALFKIATYAQTELVPEKINFVREISDTCRELGPYSEEFIIPIINSLTDESSEIKILLASKIPDLTSFFVQETRNFQAINKGIIPVIKKLLSDEIDVSKAMVDNLLSIASLMSFELIQSELSDIINEMLKDENNEEDIAIGIDLVKGLMKTHGIGVWQLYIAEVLERLIQSNSIKIKKSLIGVLGTACETFPYEYVKDEIIQMFLTLSQDGNWGIRKACSEAIIPFFKVCDAETLNKFILPVFYKFLKDKSKWVQQESQNLLPQVIVYFKGEIPEKLIKTYCTIPDATDAAYFRAFYFPGVLLKLGKESWNDLKKLFMKLCTSEFKIKMCIASSLHEIAKILGSETTEKDLVEFLEDFIKNDSTKSKALTILAKFLVEVKDSRIKEKFLVYFKEMADSNNWRVRELLAGELHELIPVYNRDILNGEIFNIIQNLCRDSVNIVRKKACRSLGNIALFMINQKQGENYINLIKNIAKDSNCHIRIGFVEAAKSLCMDYELFIENFKENIEEISKDPVNNIRLACTDLIKLGVKYNSAEFWQEIKGEMSRDYDEDVKYELIGKYEKSRGVEPLEPGHGENFILFPPVFRSIHAIETVDKTELISPVEAKLVAISSYIELENHMPKDIELSA
ncbi:unnamed protein product [Blepharisma stoltei]|uniref:Phosphatase 2A Regulatory Subunit A helical domain-containing protein n=1 Tax=Blepharisma stoltei TaxID=1481888 RepID=A0AAU9KDW6_9CILI|nr:unnamed protein product [Blepharisma stoltei]